jgi:hypothetical protein
MSRDLSWSELAELTHVTQVEHFNFCLCEDNFEGNENPYADCPKEERVMSKCPTCHRWQGYQCPVNCGEFNSVGVCENCGLKHKGGNK